MGCSSVVVYLLLAVAFNLVAVWTQPPFLTSSDPYFALVALGCFALIFATVNKCFRHYRGTAACLDFVCSFLLALHGVTRHWNLKSEYASNPLYNDNAWMVAIAINLFGIVALAFHGFNRLESVGYGKVQWWMVFVTVVVGAAYVSNASKDANLCSDSSYYSERNVHSSSSHQHLYTHKPLQSSEYITMPDGVRLAAETYLPHDWDTEHDSLPTFLHFTRYNRSNKRKFPFNLMSLFGEQPSDDFNMRSLAYIREFVPNGYAFVTVDVRGTGASFGTRPVDFHPKEIADYSEVLKWVKQQPWCNGHVGTGGISYDGIAGALLASQGGVNAVGFLFSPADLYEDISFPGGIPNIGFAESYQIFTQAAEQNKRLEDPSNLVPSLFFKLFREYGLDGVLPVKGHEEELAAAVKGHASNWDMMNSLKEEKIFYKNDVIVASDDLTIHKIGFTDAVYAGLRRNKPAILAVSGFYDSCSVKAGMRLQARLPGQVKFVAGPWTHGGRKCFSPYSKGTNPVYSVVKDLRRFFDCKVKQSDCHELDHEPAAHVFVTGLEKWIGMEQFPPTEQLTAQEWHFGQNSSLIPEIAAGSSPISYRVNSHSSSGRHSRWNLVSHLLRSDITYPNRAAQTPHLATFQTAELTTKVVVVGSPKVTVRLDLIDGTDATVFVYLEDVFPDGRIVYVTEGQVRTSNTVTRRAPSVGSPWQVRRTFTRGAVESSNSVTVELTIEPVAYAFLAGHKIRLSLSGSDVDNFYQFDAEKFTMASEWNIHLDQSSIQLPVASY